jgi:hypothetical protein
MLLFRVKEFDIAVCTNLPSLFEFIELLVMFALLKLAMFMLALVFDTDSSFFSRLFSS